MQKCLMLCPGDRAPERLLYHSGFGPAEWTTLDVDPDLKPDVEFDLGRLRLGAELPFISGTFDEIHCYSSLHMFGKQGDAAGLFMEFGEYWRVLRIGGHFFATVPAPSASWLWADPSTVRAIHPTVISYLVERYYSSGQPHITMRYKKMVRGWWEPVLSEEKDGVFLFGLRKV